MKTKTKTKRSHHCPNTPFYSVLDCQAMDSVFAALSNMTASYNLTAEDVYNMTMEGDISLDDMIEGVMDYASSQGWSLEDVFG